MSDIFIDIIKERVGEARLHSFMFTLWPRQWATYPEFHQWQLTKLDKSKRNNVPNGPGIYTLLAIPKVAGHPDCSYLMYVGQTVSLRRRFGEYLNKERKPDGRPKIFTFLDMFQNNVWFCFTIVQPSSLDSVESGLRDAYVPPLNENFAGELSPIVSVLRW